MHVSMARSMELKGRLSHIKKGDSLTMDGFVVVEGYCIPYLRSFAKGHSFQDYATATNMQK